MNRNATALRNELAELWLSTVQVVRLGIGRRRLYRMMERGEVVWREVEGGRETLLSSLPSDTQERHRVGPIYKDSLFRALPNVRSRVGLELEAVRRWNLIRDFFETLPPALRTSARLEDLNRELTEGIPTELDDCPDLAKPRCLASLARIHRLAQEHGPEMTLGRHGPRRKGYGERLSPEAKLYLQELWPACNLSYMVAWTTYQAQAKEAGWKEVSYSTVRLFLKALPRDEVLFARLGERRWQNDYAPSIRRERQKVAGKHWVADHHQFDVMVWDGDGGMPFRPWFSSVLDQDSCAEYGWAIVTQPTALVIAEVILHGVSPKNRPEYELLCGIPDTILTDNGKDYLSRMVAGERPPAPWTDEHQARLRGVIEKLGATHKLALVYRARSKSVERFHGTLCEGYSKFLGNTYFGNKPDNRSEAFKPAWKEHERFLRKEVGQTPFMTLTEFRRLFEKWLFLYHHRPHRSLSVDGVQRSPLDWMRLYSGTREILQDSSAELIAMPTDRRKVQLQGIVQCRKLTYFHEALCRFPEGTGVTVAMPERELGRIYVYDRCERFICEATSPRGFRLDEISNTEELKRKSKYVRGLRERVREVNQKAPRGLRPIDAVAYGVADPSSETFVPADAIRRVLPQYDRVKLRQSEAPPPLPDLVFDEEPVPAPEARPRLRGLFEDSDDVAVAAGGGGENR